MINDKSFSDTVKSTDKNCHQNLDLKYSSCYFEINDKFREDGYSYFVDTTGSLLNCLICLVLNFIFNFEFKALLFKPKYGFFPAFLIIATDACIDYSFFIHYFIYLIN